MVSDDAIGAQVRDYYQLIRLDYYALQQAVVDYGSVAAAIYISPLLNYRSSNNSFFDYTQLTRIYVSSFYFVLTTCCLFG